MKQGRQSPEKDAKIAESETEYIYLVYGSEAKRNQAFRQTYNEVLKKELSQNTEYFGQK